MSVIARAGRRTRHAKRAGRTVAMGLLAFALAACSVPDYVNPVNWFDSKEKKQEIAAAKPAPGKDQPFPKLSSVPDRPDPITIARIRKELTEGLIADTNNARYTDEIIRREPPAPPPRPVQVAKAPAPAVQKPAPATAKLSTIKPPPPPKLAIAPAAPEATAESSTTAEATAPAVTAPAITAPAVPAPAKLKVAAAPATATAAEVKPDISAKALAAQKPAVSAPIASKPSTSTAALARPAPPPPPPTLPQLVVPTDTRVGDRPAQSAQVATIFFGSATAELTEDDVLVLQEVAALQRETGGVVRVVGHSSRGAPAGDRIKRGLLNFKLSLDRANAVAGALTRFGVAKDNLEVIARGDGELLYAESSVAGAAGNRRAEIFLEFF